MVEIQYFYYAVIFPQRQNRLTEVMLQAKEVCIGGERRELKHALKVMIKVC